MTDDERFERDQALYSVITQHDFSGSKLARWLYAQHATPDPKPDEPGADPPPVQEPGEHEGDEEEKEEIRV